jgi:hypothetical protein
MKRGRKIGREEERKRGREEERKRRREASDKSEGTQTDIQTGIRQAHSHQRQLANQKQRKKHRPVESCMQPHQLPA